MLLASVDMSIAESAVEPGMGDEGWMHSCGAVADRVTALGNRGGSCSGVAESGGRSSPSWGAACGPSATTLPLLLHSLSPSSSSEAEKVLGPSSGSSPRDWASSGSQTRLNFHRLGRPGVDHRFRRTGGVLGGSGSSTWKPRLNGQGVLSYCSTSSSTPLNASTLALLSSSSKGSSTRQ
ncbi:hypothetical protein BDY21DRAFT_350265 [Lineolata rhizophorae]|uniref:Uncharacterized protein n=1 Tax=Lineolata rhizophorae TaxID=578093 RepID=A0A6A6NU26_9PEZI|nr:hypothetical protein BDY21DRAFT_350265 [Lineolata rhizophorae]